MAWPMVEWVLDTLLPRTGLSDGERTLQVIVFGAMEASSRR